MNRQAPVLRPCFRTSGTITLSVCSTSPRWSPGRACQRQRPLTHRQRERRGPPSGPPSGHDRVRGRLKPGKYTFEVRALNAAGPEPTPATKSFTIA